MKSELKNINGFQILKLPEELNKLGDLMYFDGALMSVYINNNNEPYILDWVEASDSLNRWLVYKVEKESLADYVFCKKTHFELLNNPVNDIIFFIDRNSKGETVKCIISSPKNLPYEYLPDYSLKFEIEDAKNLDVIIQVLNLENIDSVAKFQFFDILQEAKKNNNELVNLHIKSTTSKVGYGKIYSSILGQVLTNYHRLSKATALNIFDNKAKLPKDERPKRKKGELENIGQLAEMEFVYAKAASFSVFLRPIVKTYDLFDGESTCEKIVKNVFVLFEASTSIEKLKLIKSSLSENMLTAYTTFLKEIKEEDITLAVQYGNPSKNFKLENTFNPQKANQILTNLDVLEYENTNEYRVKGWFKALDSLTHTFKFETNDKDVYSGKFSNQLKEGIFHFNLMDYYSVTLEIFESKKSGMTTIHEKVTMVSCVKEVQ